MIWAANRNVVDRERRSPGSLVRDQCAYFLTLYNRLEIVFLIDIEYYNRQVILLTEGESGHIHDTQPQTDYLDKGKGVKLCCFRVFFRVGRVNTIDASSLEDHFGIDFISA